MTNVTCEQLMEIEKLVYLQNGGDEDGWNEAIESGEIEATEVDSKHDGNYVVYKFRIKNLFGTFEAWEQDGVASDEWNWVEV